MSLRDIAQESCRVGINGYRRLGNSRSIPSSGSACDAESPQGVTPPCGKSSSPVDIPFPVDLRQPPDRTYKMYASPAARTELNVICRGSDHDMTPNNHEESSIRK